VELAALDDRVVEHLGYGAAERLGAVDHHQDRSRDLQATLPQPNQQVTHHGGVLGGALGQSERDLGAVDGDAEGDHAGVLSHSDAVDQQRHQVQPGQILGEQLGQGVLGPGDKPTGDRRLRRPRSGGRNPGADRFQPRRVAARRQLGKHPLQRQLAEQLGRGERLVGRHRQLSGAVSRPDPGPAHPHPAAAESHLAELSAVADRRPVGVVAASGADQPGDVLVEYGLKHLQAGPHCQGQQPLAGGAGQFSHCDGHSLGQVQLRVVDRGGALDILRHGGPLLVELLGSCPTPTTRQVSGGDRHFKFYGNWDNLGADSRSAKNAAARGHWPRDMGCVDSICVLLMSARQRSSW
jgi:hypothetical protein